MGRVSTCQKNCNTIDLRRAQVKKKDADVIVTSIVPCKLRINYTNELNHILQKKIRH